jgi:hypothetical protein
MIINSYRIINESSMQNGIDRKEHKMNKMRVFLLYVKHSSQN